jgi:hypothetical protein
MRFNWIDYLKKHNHTDSAGEDERVLLFLDHGMIRQQISSVPGNWPPAVRQCAATAFRIWLPLCRYWRNALAIQALDDGIADDVHHSIEEQTLKLLGRAYVECTAGDFGGCLRDESAGFALNRSPEHAFIADTILGLARSAAPASFRTRIHRELEHVAGFVPTTRFGTLSHLLKLRTQGELELAESHLAAALHTFEALAAKDVPAVDRECQLAAMDTILFHCTVSGH